MTYFYALWSHHISYYAVVIRCCWWLLKSLVLKIFASLSYFCFFCLHKPKEYITPFALWYYNALTTCFQQPTKVSTKVSIWVLELYCAILLKYGTWILSATCNQQIDALLLTVNVRSYIKSTKKRNFFFDVNPPIGNQALCMF